MPHRPRVHGILAGLFVLSLACGEVGPAGPPPVSAAPPSSIDGLAVSGHYAVRGVTVQALSGRQREIGGTLALDVHENRYAVTFELATTAPDLEGEVPVRVAGDGSGFLVGDVLTGTTQEWMSLETSARGLGEVALDAELPARAGRKIVSTSHASFEEDGSFEIVLQNYPAPGEDYEPSMTVLRGQRIDAPEPDRG